MNKVQPARVLLADDHVPTRMVVRAALEAEGFEVVADCGNGTDAARLVAELRPDLALLDVHMPGDGIIAAVRVAETAPTTAVVMFTASRAPADLADALRAGARGYLLKDSDAASLGSVLRRVLAGETVYPRSSSHQVDLSVPAAREPEEARVGSGGRRSPMRWI